MESQQKIQQLQFLEQNLQAVLMQKQAFQMEISETKTALKEIENSKDVIYKVVGQLMISSSKEKITDELIGKEKLITTRIQALEKQEEAFAKQIQELRKELGQQ